MKRLKRDRLILMSALMSEVQTGKWQGQVAGGPLAHGSEVKPSVTFDLKTWLRESDQKVTASGVSCGYSACSVGHACVDERFNALGLSFEVDKWRDLSGIGSVPTFKRQRGWGAVEDFFGIEPRLALYFFEHTSYRYKRFSRGWTPIRPEEIGNRIVQFLKYAEKFPMKYLLHCCQCHQVSNDTNEGRAAGIKPTRQGLKDYLKPASVITVLS